MKIALYIIIFIMGTFFGSFTAYAIKRIPKNKKISNEKSSCPNCKHKIGIFDSIPVLSYILLGGKCRYCGKKISSSYFWTELLMGFVSLGIYMSIHGIWGTMSLLTLTEYLYLMIFVTTITIIAGIDKNNKKIYKPIIFVGSVIGLIHIIYLYFINSATQVSLYRYIIYVAIICILSFITSKYKYFQYKYILELLIICVYINLYVVSEVFLITAVLTMILLVADVIVNKRKNRIDNSDILAENETKQDIPIAFWLCISTIAAILIQGIVI